jgi:hypothetical protein
MPRGAIGGFYDANKVLVGSAVAFLAPVATPDPHDSITVFDPAVWTTPWKSCGGTEQGWTVNWNPSVNDIRIDEQATPVDQEMDSATLQFVANLAEDTVQSWGLAMNATATAMAAGTGQPAKSRLVPSDKLLRYKVVLESQTTGDFPVRFIVPEMTCAANVGASFRRAAGARLIPVTFTSVCEISAIAIDFVTGPGT